MFKELRVVDNRVFLLGLDKLYREAMKRHESGELLMCARRVAEALELAPADVPVEGYYAEDERLTEYFRLVRALQVVDEGKTSSVDSLSEFQRLRDVTSAPLYGRPQYEGRLLPTGRDALSQALIDTSPNWTVESLIAAAYNTARELDEISLVGLAARIKDAVVLTALRESVVLYAQAVLRGAFHPPRPEYVWEVDKDLARQARRFIDTFNTLFGESLPPPDPAQAELYWRAYNGANILGRCVRIGCDDSILPIRHYHWAIYRAADGGFAVQEFWNHEVWTTTRYRSAFQVYGRRPEL
jgi:hypothetical protein